mmetsp:Transcript_24086/g.45779  ORF Transcript_24086/g.45779 Transcript_24086/m.45779 type:complete len:142 (-) Transcript_24086:46-471(-)
MAPVSNLRFLVATTAVALLTVMTLTQTVHGFVTKQSTRIQIHHRLSLKQEQHWVTSSSFFSSSSSMLHMVGDNKNNNNNRDVSRSGTKRERLNRLAELQEDEIATDKSFVLKAAGGFVALLVLITIIGAASGAFDDLFMQM